MPFKHSWKTHEKRGGIWKYSKYDTVLKVIVADILESDDNGRGSRKTPKQKVPSAIYLSKLAMELLGNPSHIEIVKDGDLIGFRSTLPDDPNGYVVNRPVKKSEDGVDSTGRPFLSVRGVINEYGLRSGAYEGNKEINGAEVVIYFNSKSEPSVV